ncbi:MAG: hypothetical protein ACKO0Z_22990 [Betaproteobacteria bacterium]
MAQFIASVGRFESGHQQLFLSNGLVFVGRRVGILGGQCLQSLVNEGCLDYSVSASDTQRLNNKTQQTPQKAP